MLNRISPVSFNGLKVEGVISTKNLKNFGEFASAAENIEFVKDLEKNFNTNMVIKNDFKEISFSHEVFGNLKQFGCLSFSVENFYSKVVEARNSIKQAIKKAEKFYEHQKQENDKIFRGC